MAKYTQSNRPLRIYTTLDPDKLLLSGFSLEEAVSQPYTLSVEMFSEDGAIDTDALLRTAAFVEVDLPDGSIRTVHGMIRRIVQLGRVEKLVSYYAEIVPWFWFLSLTTNSRIFQDMTAVDIVSQIFGDAGSSAPRDYGFSLTKIYEAREYCVQYRESDLAFVSRLLQEEGICFFFEHTKDAHKLVLADTTSAMAMCAGQSKVRLRESTRGHTEDVLTGVRWERCVHPGRITLRDFDYLQPTANLTTSIAGTQSGELYRFPGKYTGSSPGDRLANLERLATMQLEEQEAQHLVLRGEGNVRALQSGCRFDLADHYRKEVNGQYQLLEVSSAGRAGDFTTWESADIEYRSSFTAIPAGVPYRPPRTTPNPVVDGVQTAIVVGPTGEEIYTDEHGRVKVQFHWDRHGTMNENSSCWVRVSSSWAGRNWGAINLPRISQEVVVDFIEGDPDRPIIVGAVYNATHMPPYALPASKTRSTVKSRSSLGGGASNYNEIRMEDKAGSEEFYIHAEKDLVEDVKNDRTRTVAHDETVTVKHDRSLTVENDEIQNVENDRTRDVSVDETITIGNDQSITVQNDRTQSIARNEVLNVGGARTVNVGGNEVKSVDGTSNTDVDGAVTVTFRNARTTAVSNNDQLTVGKKLAIVAGDEISLKSGSAEITLKKNGDIKIKGKNIKVEGSGTTEVKGSSVKLN